MKHLTALIRALGQAGLYSQAVLRASRPSRDFFAELTREIYKIGGRSLPIIAVGGAFVGLSVILLGYRALDTYGASNQVSAMLGLGQCAAVELAHGLAEIHTQIAHQEADRIVVRAAAEAMHEALLRDHRERRRALVVERAQSSMFGASAPKLDVAPDDLDQIGAREQRFGVNPGHAALLPCGP